MKTVALPGFEWLRRQLSRTEMVSGGWDAKVKQPVMGGAGLVMSVVWVLVWLVGLLPLCVWAGVRWAVRRRSDARP